MMYKGSEHVSVSELKTHFRGPFHANFVKPSTGLYPANLSRCQNVVPNAEVEPGDLALFSLSTGLFAAVYLYHRLIQPRLMALNVCGLMRAGHVGLIGLVIPLLSSLLGNPQRSGERGDGGALELRMTGRRSLENRTGKCNRRALG